jgi:hypothetical protein
MITLKPIPGEEYRVKIDGDISAAELLSIVFALKNRKTTSATALEAQLRVAISAAKIDWILTGEPK